MGNLVKIISALLVIGALYIWATGRSVTEREPVRVDSSSLSAGAILAPGAESGSFDQVGTIILDTSHGTPAKPFLLYAVNNENGNTSVRTKRLVFSNQAACAEENLPCATNQPAAPVSAEEQVRVIGIVSDDTVEVHEIYRVSP